MTATETTPPPTDVFGRATVPLPTAAEAGAADEAARTQFGVPERVLMENAARAAALVLTRLFPQGRVVGVAGSGHNGGDLAVMLRVLHAWGRDVAVIAAGTRAPDAALLHGAALDVIDVNDAAGVLARADVLVDGMLGTGSSGAPRGRIAEWIDRLNALSRPILALDLPSGVDASSGSVSAVAIRATATVSFGWPKLGLLLHPARAYCGRLIACEIGFPAAALAARARAITSDWARHMLRPRAATAHKGSAGRLLVLAGSEGMAGAAAIAAEAALRAGTGLLRIASATANREILQKLVPEATFLDRDRLTETALEPMHALLAGPGLGADHAARDSLQRALELMPQRAAVLDADALNLFAREPDALRAIGAARPLVITPHAKELSRLLRVELNDIVADPVSCARHAADRFQCVVLLKGQPSMVATPAGELWVTTVGSSDLATAGMGDQLCGVMGALLAGGHTPLEAAALGLYLSGRAADVAALGRSLSPRDVSAGLPAVWRDPGPRESTLGLPFITFDQPPRW